jgi:diacylglycerol O-acyltransferase
MMFSSICQFSPIELLQEVKRSYFSGRTAQAFLKDQEMMGEFSPLRKILRAVIFTVWIFVGLFAVWFKWLKAAFIRDPKTIYRSGKLGSAKRLAWTNEMQAIDVNDCNEIGVRYSATINDVLVSCLCGAMGKYMDKHQSHVDYNTRVRLATLVNVRNPALLLQENKKALEVLLKPTNCIGFITSTVPIHGINNPIIRLEEVKNVLGKEKRSAERYVSHYAQYLGVMLPRAALKWLYDYLVDGITFVVSNVRGPPLVVFNGLRVKRVLGFVPCTAGLEFVALIISYDGKLNLCLNVNANTIENPTEIIKDFVEEYQELKRQCDLRKS